MFGKVMRNSGRLNVVKGFSLNPILVEIRFIVIETC
jgi:hypothetical protein